MTRVDKISAPNYKHNRHIIDELVRDEDFDHSGMLIEGTKFTWLEVLRTMFAYTISMKRKRLQSAESIKEMINEAEIQAWLNWIKDASTTGAKTAYGTSMTPFSHYSLSPGLSLMRWITVTEYGSEVYSARNLSLKIDKIKNIITEGKLVMHEEAFLAIEKMVEKARKICSDTLERHAIAKVYAEKWHEGIFDKFVFGDNTYELLVKMLSGDYEAKAKLSIGNGKRVTDAIKTMKLDYDPSSMEYTIERNSLEGWPNRALVTFKTPQGTKIEVSVTPFSFKDDENMNQLCHALILGGYADQLATEVERDISNTEWAKTANPEISFTVGIYNRNYAFVKNAQDVLPEINLKPVIRFKQISGTLTERKQNMFVGNTAFPIGSENTIVDIYKNSLQKNAGMTPQAKLLEEIEKIHKIKQRRQNRIGTLGDNTIEIDKIAEHMLNIAKNSDPQRVALITSGKSTLESIQIPKEDLKGFCNARGKKVKVTFNTSEGLLLTRFYITPDVLWDKRRLITTSLPQSLMENLKGKPARDVIDHPIADMLGPVRRASRVTNSKKTSISFELERKKLVLSVASTTDS